MNWTDESTMNWSHESTTNKGPFQLSVGPGSGRRWQHFTFSFGRHSEAAHEECLKTWPREAIALARKELDDLETLLGENE